MASFEPIFTCIRSLYADEPDSIPLHAPVFAGNEKTYLAECIDTGWVSSVGPFVDRFEQELRRVSSAEFCIPTVNGTAALQVALVVAGTQPGDLVLTQGLTFVATANAISHAGATPVFLDSDYDTLGMAPTALRRYLELHALRTVHGPIHRDSGRRIAACVPVHVLGHGCRIDALLSLCNEWGIPLIEDATEALGSRCANRQLGTIGLLGVLSFNGNKTITTGGGGAILTNSPEIAARARHLTTTAKVPHPWEFFHDAVAWNYRMPNINAALGCAQLEMLPAILAAKQRLASAYRDAFASTPWQFLDTPAGCSSNFWLCSVAFNGRPERDRFLQEASAQGIMARPLWRLMPDLPMYASCDQDGLTVAHAIVDRVVSLPSSTPRRWLKEQQA